MLQKHHLLKVFKVVEEWLVHHGLFMLLLLILLLHLWRLINAGSARLDLLSATVASNLLASRPSSYLLRLLLGRLRRRMGASDQVITSPITITISLHLLCFLVLLGVSVG